MANYFQIVPPLDFSFSPTAEISRLELEFEESLPRKTASIFKEGIRQESNGAANQVARLPAAVRERSSPERAAEIEPTNQEKQIFLLCHRLPSSEYVVYATAYVYRELYGKITERKKNCVNNYLS